MELNYYYIWNYDLSKGVRYVTGDTIVLTDSSWLLESYATKEEAQKVINKFDLKGYEII